MKKSNIALAIVCIVLFGSSLFALNIGLNKTEAMDCLKWQKEAREYSNYYLLKWQKMQCDAHNITIDAVVK